MRLLGKRVGFGFALLSLTAGLAVAAPSNLRLVDAVAERNWPLVPTLLKEGVDANAARADGSTALLWAAHWDNREAIDLLLRAGAKVNAADDHGVTPLARACENGSESAVTRLLEAGANPNTAQTNGLTPLMIAARTGDVRILNALLARGANVNAETARTHDTALMWAIAEKHREVVRALVDKGADVHPRPQQAFSPLMGAAKNGDIETAKILVAAGARANDTGADGTYPLPYAIISGQATFAHFLLELGADPNGTVGGATALHAASGPIDVWLRGWHRSHGTRSSRKLKLEERELLVKTLLDRGANPNARMAASEMAGLGYLRNGAYDTFTTGVGDLADATPMWVAAYATNPGEGSQSFVDRNRVADSSAQVIRMLLAAGGKPDLPTRDGSTPLMAAAGCGRAAHATNVQRADRQPMAEDAAKVLLDAGANVNTINESDTSPLHCAAFTGLNELVQLFVDRGADINARDWRGRTPYRLAQASKQSFHLQEWPEVAALLEKLGADTSLGIPGTVQERLRGLAAAQQQQ
jgi:ankyrin repeat protein